jgi:outer membrane immunogenic protein
VQVGINATPQITVGGDILKADGNGEREMKNFLLASVGLVALIGIAAPASAADMAVKARPPAPVLAPIYDWTGFYIGANGGWGQSRNCWDFVNDGVFVLGTFAEGCNSRSGGVVGGQIGYRWQANQWVFGLEAQGDWADLSHTRVSLLDPTLSLRTKTDVSASLPARSATPGMQRCST